MKVRWAPAARRDLRAIKTYIARDSQEYAARMVERITSAVLQLESFPELGARIVGWGREDLREIIVGNYRVIYRLTAKTVYIVTVIHAARSYPSDAN